MSRERPPMPEPLQNWSCVTAPDGSALLTRSRAGRHRSADVPLLLLVGCTLFCALLLTHYNIPIPICVGWTMPGWGPAVPVVLTDVALLACTGWVALLRQEWQMWPNRMVYRKKIFGRSWARSFRDAFVTAEHYSYMDRTGPRSKSHYGWQLWVRTAGHEKMFLLDSKREDTIALGEFISERTGWLLRVKR